MLSIRFLLGVGIGAAAGYGFCRALEARAHGVSLQDAFKLDTLLTPVMNLPVTRPVGTFAVSVQPPGSCIGKGTPGCEQPLTDEQVNSLRNFKGALLPSIRPRGVMGMGHARLGTGRYDVD